jgi:hypothetical protein
MAVREDNSEEIQLRWLFIEQDVTYWSGQGRGMLYNRILEI